MTPETSPQDLPTHAPRRSAPRGAAALVRWLIWVALLGTPLFTAGEVLALIQGRVQSQTVAYTPVFLKAGKDVLLAATAGLAVFGTLLSGRTNRLALPAIAFVLYLCAAAVQASIIDPRLSVAGLRWALPLLLPVLLVPYVDRAMLERIARLLSTLLFVHLAVQVAELFVMSSWYGTSAFGLAARVPGFFFIPGTAGFFAVVCALFAYFYLPIGARRRFVLATAPVSALLTQSGTAIGALAMFAVLVWIGPRWALVLAPLGPLAIYGILLVLPLLTGRGGEVVNVSGATRVRIFDSLVSRGELFPSAFGVTTNTAVSFAQNIAALRASGVKALIVDSTYASIVGNLGLVGSGLFLVAVALWVGVLLRTTRVDLYAFTLVFALYGATTIIPETYPMSLLSGVLGAYFLREVYLPGLPPLHGRARRGGADAPVEGA